jgi:hypothetical protein
MEVPAESRSGANPKTWAVWVLNGLLDVPPVPASERDPTPASFHWVEDVWHAASKTAAVPKPKSKALGKKGVVLIKLIQIND